jgi:hypothetical protein
MPVSKWLVPYNTKRMAYLAARLFVTLLAGAVTVNLAA